MINYWLLVETRVLDTFPADSLHLKKNDKTLAELLICMFQASPYEYIETSLTPYRHPMDLP